MADIELRVAAEGVSEASSEINRLAGTIKDLGASVLTLESLKKVGEWITDNQRAMIQLDNAYQNFGSHLTQTKGDLLKWAEDSQKSTTLLGSNIAQGEAVLLRFASLTEEQFNKAREVMLDLAAQMGGDTTEAARKLGIALERPEMAMRLLRQFGVVLSADLQKLVKDLAANGQQADAQNIILHELSTRMVKASEDTKTLGGSITQLKNSFKGLFETINTKPLVDAIHDINKDVSSSGFKQGMDALTGFLGKYLQVEDKILGGVLSAFTGFSYGGHVGDVLGTNAPLSSTGPTGRSLPNPDTFVLPKVRPDILQEQQAKDLPLPEKGALDQYFQGLDDATKTGLEKISDDWNTFVVSLIELRSESLIDQEEFNKRYLAKIDELFGEGFEEHLPKQRVPQFSELTKLGKQAAEQLQAAFTNMFDKIGQGGVNMGATLVAVFKRILAEALATDLVKALGIAQLFSGAGNTGANSSGSGGSSVIGSILRGVGSFFGIGGLASGGYAVDRPVIVGESGPELLVPGYQGTSVIPQNSWGGAGGGINYNSSTVINGTGVSAEQLSVLVAKNNDNQRAELMRMLDRNGVGRMRS